MNNELPLDMIRDETCCFTGHRIVPKDQYDAVASETERAVRALAEAGYRYFICGGALGYDTLAAQIVLKLTAEYPIKLFLALPCRDQTENWTKMKNIDAGAAMREYQRIKALASAVYYVRDFYEEGCMKERNQFMVDHSSFCIAYYNGKPRSGAGQTVRMAEKGSLAVYNVFDEILK